MSQQTQVRKRFHLPLDVWAVIVALTLVALVRVGLITKVPW